MNVTTEHDQGVPAWPRWRLMYALWSNAEDWRTRRSLVRLVVQRILARAH